MTKTFTFTKFGFVTLVGLTSVFVLSGCDKPAQTGARPPSPVAVIEVVKRDVPADMTWVAKTESSRAVEIYSRVTGFLDQRNYTEGAMVDEGQVLFLMDKKPFEVQLAEAEASLASSQAAHLVAKQNLDRVRPLAKVKALSQTDLDQAVANFETTKAQVSNAQAQVESAKLNLSYCTITSPVKGYASSALVTDGTYINNQNSHLATVYSMSPMWVTFSMSENEEAKLKKEVETGILQLPHDLGFTVDLELAGGVIYPQEGRLTFASPNFNPDTGTFEIRASFDNPNNQLRPQQYVRAIVKGAKYANAIVVPQISVMQGSKGHFVWVINKDNKAQFRPVEVGQWVGPNWLITSGLEQGDKVVFEGMLLLSQDGPVQIVKEMKQAADGKDVVVKAPEATKTAAKPEAKK